MEETLSTLFAPFFKRVYYKRTNLLVLRVMLYFQSRFLCRRCNVYWKAEGSRNCCLSCKSGKCARYIIDHYVAPKQMSDKDYAVKQSRYIQPNGFRTVITKTRLYSFDSTRPNPTAPPPPPPPPPLNQTFIQKNWGLQGIH